MPRATRKARSRQGSDWDGDLGAATQWPHRLYLIGQLAEACGATGDCDGWTIQVTFAYPATDELGADVPQATA
jgi:hypothetical protein